ncbi:MAG: protein-methionine-sulfoxide reductase catalytic subunit MsrP [Anaerolineales bacterium]|nr:protein-methionine-sulfoxide reductase catalytic subunit MsrP [Anaerolineales bacterium]
MKIRSSEITPEHVYLARPSRRAFLKLALAAAGGAGLVACAPPAAPTLVGPTPAADGQTDELGDAVNRFEDIVNYNNYYEFTTDKAGVAGLAAGFTTDPWTVEVSGLVNKPKTFGLEDIRQAFTSEERIFRLRCVEAWSMVIPWNGFSLSEILNQVEPTSDARFVKFTTVSRPEEMPGLSNPLYPWPYTEGLRLDEAMHPLTTVATGLYGRDLLPQSGAPIRLVVPWKYGFKSIKSIVKIELTAEQPATLWNTVGPSEYGFYSNVNPEVDHPRWSQASERRIGEISRRATLKFNGYETDVADLYAGLDLAANY